jgi:hypothetical protein
LKEGVSAAKKTGKGKELTAEANAPSSVFADIQAGTGAWGIKEGDSASFDQWLSAEADSIVAATASDGDGAKIGGDGDSYQPKENIWISSSDGDFKALKWWVEVKGLSVDVQDENGYSPLAACVSYDHTDMINWLLDNGADPNIKDTDGETPLFMCEDVETADLLISRGTLVVSPPNNTECPTFRSAPLLHM